MAATRKTPAGVDVSDVELFVSLNPEKKGLVTRWGTRSFIGADRDPAKPRTIHYFPGRVLPIFKAEFRRYRSEYNDALKAGHLLRRTEADYRESLKAEADEQKKLKAKAEKRRANLKPKEQSSAPVREEVANGVVDSDSSGD